MRRVLEPDEADQAGGDHRRSQNDLKNVQDEMASRQRLASLMFNR